MTILEMITKPRRSIKNRNSRFVPTSLGESHQSVLEGRTFAAPLLWRQPNGYSGSLNSLDIALAVASSAIPQPNDVTLHFDEFSASAHSSSTAQSQSGLTTVTLTGSSTADAVDLTQTSPPNAHVGIGAISADTSNYVTVASSGIGEPVGNWMDANSIVTRNYVLADTSGSPASATLAQHAFIEYAAGTDNFAMSARANGLSRSIGGLRINAAGNGTGITTAFVGGNSVAIPSSGTVFDAYWGNMITYTASSTKVEAWSSLTVTLPTVTGSVQGIDYTVNTGSQLVTPTGLIPDDGSSLVTTHFSADFV